MCCSPPKPGGYAAATGSCATTTVRGGRLLVDAAGQSCPAAVLWGLVNSVVWAGHAAAKPGFRQGLHWMAVQNIAHSRRTCTCRISRLQGIW